MGNISDKLQYLAETKEAIKTAIKARGVDVSDTEPFRTYADKISDIRQGAGAGDDIKFYDYDGNLVYRYSADAFLALDAMPPLPTHNGLDAVGWTMTLDEAKDFISYGCGKFLRRVNLGALYKTSDGKARLHICITSNNQLIQFNVTANKCIINWGDGHEEDAISDVVEHTYQSTGNYIIEITNTSDSNISFSWQPQNIDTALRSMFCSESIRGSVSNAAYLESIAWNATQSWALAFNQCYSLRFIALPPEVSNVTLNGCYNLEAIGSNAIWSGVVKSDYGVPSLRELYGAYTSGIGGTFPSLTNLSGLVNVAVCATSGSVRGNTCIRTAIVVPPFADYKGKVASNRYNGCTSLQKIGDDYYDFVNNRYTINSLGSEAFRDCSSLQQTMILNCELSDSAFMQCYSLKRVIINKSISSVASRAFYGCGNMEYIDFSKQTVIPTIGNETFSGCPAKFIVPDSLYDQFIADSAWSTYASQIVKASEYNG